jgi:RimJ/RimL family protein N-acetyltransferase
VRRRDATLLGAVGLRFEQAYAWAELGYWIGVRYWNKGYCTEAAQAVIDYAFAERGLNRVHARHFASNPASGRVMAKLGMTREGLLRQHVIKDDRYEDLVCYGLLRSEWHVGDSKGKPDTSDGTKL